jgi:hypothetical protein
MPQSGGVFLTLAMRDLLRLPLCLLFVLPLSLSAVLNSLVVRMRCGIGCTEFRMPLGRKDHWDGKGDVARMGGQLR